MNISQKKQYHPPKLSLYGTLTQITQGGVSGQPEQAQSALPKEP